MRLSGLHHVTALTSDLGAAGRFYRDLLGLAQHPAEPEEGLGPALAFGDELARPGGVVVLSEQRGRPRGRAAAGFVHTIRWRVADLDALGFWRQRLASLGVTTTASNRMGPALRFRDPDGLAHELALDRSGDPPLVARAPRISQAVAIRGIDGIRAYARHPVPTTDLLAGRLEFEAAGPEELRIAGRERTSEFRLDSPPRRIARPGPGTVHHVAWSCEREHLTTWRQRVIGMGAQVTPVKRQRGIECLYFREPSGVLFELTAEVERSQERPLFPRLRRGRGSVLQAA